jgi:hypothetical protein
LAWRQSLSLLVPAWACGYWLQGLIVLTITVTSNICSTLAVEEILLCFLFLLTITTPKRSKLGRPYLLHFANKETEGPAGKMALLWPHSAYVTEPKWKARSCQGFSLSPTACNPHVMLWNMSTIYKKKPTHSKLPMSKFQEGFCHFCENLNYSTDKLLQHTEAYVQSYLFYHYLQMHRKKTT